MSSSSPAFLTGGEAADQPTPCAVAFGEWLAASTGGLPLKLRSMLSQLLSEGALRFRSIEASRWVVDIPDVAEVGQAGLWPLRRVEFNRSVVDRPPQVVAG
jgi:hypothetical protein